MELNCSVLLNNISERHNYKNLKFGGSPAVCIGLLGKASTKSIEKILQTYRIPKGELIAAHLTKKVLLMIDGVLITDKALYVNPSCCPKGVPNRIPWGELPQYFVAHANDTAETVLYHPNGQRYVLLRSTIIDKISGRELVEFIQGMQVGLVANYEELRSDRTHSFQALRDEYEDRILSNILDVEQESILKHLFYEPAYAEASVTILATIYAKLYPQMQYLEWVKKLPEVISEEVRQKLRVLWKTTVESFMIELKSNTTQFDKAFLSAVYKNHASLEMDTPNGRRLEGILCAMLGVWEDFNLVIGHLKELNLKEDANDLYFSYYFYENSQMLSILQLIKDGRELSESSLCHHDGIGLNPIHYLMIVGNEAAIDFLTYNSNWPNIKPQQYSAFDNIGIYDYFNLAAYTNMPFEVFRQLARSLDANAAEIDKEIYHAQSALRAMQTSTRFADFTQSAYDKFGYDDEGKAEQFRVDPAELKEQELYIHELQNELNNRTYDIINDATANIRQWKASTWPIVHYLLYLYSSPIHLENMLRTDSVLDIFWSSNDFVCVAPKSEIEAHQLTEDCILEDVKIEKLFGDSWFSEEAHIDIKTLKKEFRGLAKKYHPDISDTAQASAIFKDISAEYDYLQEQYENGD